MLLSWMFRVVFCFRLLMLAFICVPFCMLSVAWFEIFNCRAYCDRSVLIVMF